MGVSQPAEKQNEFEQLAASVRKKAVLRVRKAERLIGNLHSDREKHGDPKRWKRFGELLLANPNAPRHGTTVRVTDYFSENTPVVEIEGDPHLSVSEIAEGYFRLYTKARNGETAIAERMAAVEKELHNARSDLQVIETSIAAEDFDFLRSRLKPPQKPIAVTRKKKIETEFKGARRFLSSDGFEILVGKRAADNDFLTFRVAKSLDTWMHAADYPGSHVVIRNAGRKTVPQKTLIEAAQLAAFYSDAREKPKAAVNYTLKKFVNKPKRSAPGLVSLSSFRTLLVEPQVPADITQP
jgi:predicted ribosome quality control (RQC) complex YloA/Tae2 family protein